MAESEIYHSPDVYRPETGDLELPVHTDIRGSIHRLEIAGQKINMLFTKKGFMRSGDLHKNTQMDFIFSGEVEIWTRVNGRDIKTIYQRNRFIELPPHTPHLFHFLEDTLMAEWWNSPFEAWYFRPYRQVIDEQFKKMTQK